MFSNFLKSVVNTVAPEITVQRPPSHGFRVLKVVDASPCAQLGMESFFDFLVAVDGVHLTGDTGWLRDYLKHAQREIVLSLWSVKGQVLRDVEVPPPALSGRPLGVSLRWCPTHPTIENVYHVLDVANNSPAARAGLRSHEDFIVGTPEGIVRGESGMAELIEDHLGRPLKLFVFNAYYNTTRQVILVANKQWGGQGSMGCGIGFGALHRLPRPLSEPPAEPGQTMFEAPPEQSGLLTGAQLSASLDVPAMERASPGITTAKGSHQPPPARTKKKTRMTAADIEAMAAEASVDSRPPSRATDLPPPPKVTSPLPRDGEPSLVEMTTTPPTLISASTEAEEEEEEEEEEQEDRKALA